MLHYGWEYLWVHVASGTVGTPFPPPVVCSSMNSVNWLTPDWKKAVPGYLHLVAGILFHCGPAGSSQRQPGKVATVCLRFPLRNLEWKRDAQGPWLCLCLPLWPIPSFSFTLLSNPDQNTIMATQLSEPLASNCRGIFLPTGTETQGGEPHSKPPCPSTVILSISPLPLSTSFHPEGKGGEIPKKY